MSATPLTPRAVVFDLDGLMFNTEEIYEDVGAEVLRRRGKEFTAELMDAMMGRPAPVALQIMIETHALECTLVELALESAVLMMEHVERRLAPMPGVVELLDALEAAGIPKAIATSSPREFLTHVLGRFSWEPRFAFTLTAEDVVEGKPHPEIYLKAAARLGVPTGEVVVLEDSHNGCRAAAAAGAIAVAVPGGHSRRHDFTCATLVIDSLADRRLYELLGLPRPAGRDAPK